jgi:membrane carboxypeptidase/penicillin-binding protein PbpC
MPISWIATVKFCTNCEWTTPCSVCPGRRWLRSPQPLSGRCSTPKTGAFTSTGGLIGGRWAPLCSSACEGGVDGGQHAIDAACGSIGSSPDTTTRPAKPSAKTPADPSRSSVGAILEHGLAIERGYLTAASLLHDARINLETAAGLYVPQNYDHDFKGWISVRTALASSLNIPAVRTLMLLGVDAFHTRLRSLGYAGLVDDPGYYGYSLALGSAEVSLLEQVNAYRTLANGGLIGPLHLRHDKVFQPLQRIMSEQAAFIISEILSDRAGCSLTFGLANPLSTRFVSAVKTGTSKDMRDNWCLGYTGNYTERPPRIHSPADGLIIALDPNIPAHHQALLFAAQGDRAMLNWMLDGKRLGQADTLLWPPAPGNHLLLLTGSDNKAYDQVSFQVHGQMR